MSHDSLSAHIYVSRPVGNFSMAEWVYHACLVTIGSYETRVDHLLLDMVDLDVILGMDCLSPYHAILDCHAKTVRLAMLGLLRLEWIRIPGHSIIRVISYVKARRMAEKGCLAYLAYIHNSSAEVPSMYSIPVVCEFPKVFPTDIPTMPPIRYIDFYIDLVLGTQPISTPPYHMTSVELKELKEQLQDFLDNGFIRPSVSP
ncbi:uncharacterized protein [Nicotiana tomentosiformis]|uniref:uncharacterized protein n=1 Tax=Nicotiana tomentosiformis TaxID=4098 RepID=UPI00388CB6D0